MAKPRKQYVTQEERYSILQEVEREGLVVTSRKYNISSSLLWNWRRRYLMNGKEGLTQNNKQVNQEIRVLEEENERLKKIVAKQALEIEFKTEIIKKSQAHSQSGKKL